MENNSCNKRSPNASPEQKTLLVEFMKKHPELVSGKFSQNFTMKDAQVLWGRVTDLLNSCGGGATKDWKSWRKTWQDIRSRTKTKCSKALNYQRGTGGGPYQESQICAFEKDVLETINPKTIEGHTTIRESDAVFVFEGDESTPGTSAEVEKSVNDDLSIENEHSYINKDTSTSSSNSSITKTPNKSKKCLKYTEEATETYKVCLQQKNEIKAEYYKKKIEMLGRMAAAKERTAEAKERSPAAQERSAAAQERSAAAQERSAAAQERTAAAQERSAAALEQISQNITIFPSM